MGENKLDIEDSEGIKASDKASAYKAKAATDAAAAADQAAVALTGGNRSIDDVIDKSKDDLIKVRRIINEGGFKGPEKDKHLLSLHHAEWVQARNTYIDCDNNVTNKSVKFASLDKGKVQSHEIITAHNEWKDTRAKCKNADSVLTEKANQYIETDRRVRANRKADSEIYPSYGSGSRREGYQIKREGFALSESDNEDIKEGFNFYEESKVVDNNLIGIIPNQVLTYNARLPLLSDGSAIRTTSTDKTILPWGEYYVDCNSQTEVTRCNNALSKKNEYISGINKQFDRANQLLNIYYNVSSKNDNQSNLTLLEEADIKSILENQKKNIALIKQNALYDYDEYNSLAFFEDLVVFLYYAVFLILVFISLREYFSSSSPDYKKLAILVALGIYPKYILIVVLWILNGLTKITDMLGLKNVRFWV